MSSTSSKVLPTLYPDPDYDDYGVEKSTFKRTHRTVGRISRRSTMGGLLMAIGAFWLLFTHGSTTLGILYQQKSTESSPFQLQRSWAQYSPYFPVEHYVHPPQQCQVIQANIIQRHGARYPTSAISVEIKEALSKLLSAKKYKDPRFKFLKTYTYNLGTDDLVPLGAQQSQDAGRDHFIRYGHLVSQKQLPFVRASNYERTIFSATNWTEGFSTASGYMYRPKLSVILPPSLTGNSTLDDQMCPNVGNSRDQKHAWLSVYAPLIATRLNKQAHGAHLKSKDVHNLISLCAFESVSTETLSNSPFCDLFTDSEFKQYEYAGDLDKYYGTGYGQPLGPVQGVGYINELLARLTGKPVQDNTQTNRTLDTSPITFPLNRTFYIDFSHDNEMVAIYAAMGLFPQKTALNPSKPDPTRDWLASHMVPFSARMVTEKLLCGGAEGKEYVRVLVNNALQPLKFCHADKDGLCELKKFVASQAYARNDGDGDFEKCFS